MSLSITAQVLDALIMIDRMSYGDIRHIIKSALTQIYARDTIILIYNSLVAKSHDMCSKLPKNRPRIFNIGCRNVEISCNILSVDTTDKVLRFTNTWAMPSSYIGRTMWLNERYKLPIAYQDGQWISLMKEYA